jgi:hypothetical protein
MILDDDHDQSFLTSFSAVSWKTVNLEVGYLTSDGLAVAVTCDLIETPEIKYPILKYFQLKPIFGYSWNRLFSGKDEEEGNGFGIAESESWFAGLQIASIKF